MELNLEKILKESKVSFYRAGGPGGQHRNKTETGVLIKHLPTGVTGSASERRSQAQNRKEAEERLLSKLRKHYARKKKRLKTSAPNWVRENILTEKSQRGAAKKLRSRVDDSDEEQS